MSLSLKRDICLCFVHYKSDPLGGDVEIVPFIEYCTSPHMTIFLIAIYVYKALLLVNFQIVFSSYKKATLLGYYSM